MKFTIHSELPNGLGRVGTIVTSHGDIQTPAFVAVGTKGTVKSVTPEQVKEAGAQVVIANTYHLYIEPGDEEIRKLGGLHKMMNWNAPLMTDSGGFQVFSLGADFGKKFGKIARNQENLLASPSHGARREEDFPDTLAIRATIDPNGVMFRSHSDGSAHYFTPEKSIQIQHNLGADIIFAFDECTSPHESLHYQKEALDRTHRWARRSLEYHQNLNSSADGRFFQVLGKNPQTMEKSSVTPALFGIVQGGRDENLRKESAEVIGGMEFDGFGIGGSFEKEDMSTAVEWVNEILPKEKPRHLLGIGEPIDLFGASERGCDLFDCVSPTRIARNGNVYTKEGRQNLLNTKFREDSTPIDLGCACYTCSNFNRAYVAHLFRAKEMLAATLASIHNLHFIAHMVDGMRETMQNGNFEKYKKDFLRKYYGDKYTPIP